MSRRKLFLKILWLILFLFILTGFTLLSWNVSEEYFLYRTTSVTAIYDYPEGNVLAPAMILCFRFDIDPRIESKIGQLFTGERNFYNDKNDSWKIMKIKIIPHSKKANYTSKKYIMGNKYCMFLKVMNSFNMEEVRSSRWKSLSRFFDATISASPLYSPNIYNYNGKSCDVYVYIQLVSDESLIANPENRFAFAALCRDYVGVIVYVTYAASINIRKPPPFDTNCLDYSYVSHGFFLSSYDCYDKCLKNKTILWNIVSGTSIIEKNVFKDSEVQIIPDYIIEDEDYWTLEKNNSLPEELVKKYRNISSHWQRIKHSCRQLCSRPDCKIEKISPEIYHPEAVGETNKSLSFIGADLMLSYLPTFQVSYIPKQKLIDYIVYMCSMLSFWIGLCPLTLTDMFARKLENYTKKKNHSTLEERVVEKVIRKIENGILYPYPERRYGTPITQRLARVE